VDESENQAVESEKLIAIIEIVKQGEILQPWPIITKPTKTKNVIIDQELQNPSDKIYNHV